MSRTNAMGSTVVPGTACKPEVPDPDRPIMFAAAQIFICDGERCHGCHKEDPAERLRALIKEEGCHQGPERIKVTRTHCQGACRFRGFASVYQNGRARHYNQESSFSAWKGVHTWSDEEWRALLAALRAGRLPESLMSCRVAEQVYGA